MFKKLKKKLKYNNNKYENILDDPSNKIGLFLSRFITFLIVLFAFVISFETLGENQSIYYIELLYFDAFISIVFALEYFYRFFRAKDKIKFIFNPIRIIDLLSFLPFFLGLVVIGDYLKVLRLLRILRILKLIKDIPLTKAFIKALKDYRDEYKAVFLLFLIILFIGSSFVFFLEKDVSGTLFTSIPMSLWWGLVTMTAVGYGDMVPITDLGKIVAGVLVFIGPLILALASAITIMVFTESSKILEMTEKSIKGRKCPRCKTKNPHSANYCMKCGEKY